MLRSAVRSAVAGIALLLAVVLVADTDTVSGDAPAPPRPAPVAETKKVLPLSGHLVIAHRGAAKHAPENTLAAVDAAYRRGIDWVENDVQRTKDGRLVVMHDTTLKRTTDAEKVYPKRSPWRVKDFTAAEIAKLDAGSWFGKQFAGERVPTLAQYLDRVDRNGQGLLLEIKDPEKYPGIEKQIIAQLRASGWLDSEHVEKGLIIQSFGVASVRRVHAQLPALRTGILGTPSAEKLPEYAKFADWINPPFGKLSWGYVAAVHRLWGPHDERLQVSAWNVPAEDADRMFAPYGVDGLIV